MRNQLMFFRQENSDLPKPLPLRVRLQIDVEGKVIGQEILETSQVPEFDALVLKAAPLLELSHRMRRWCGSLLRGCSSGSSLK